MVHHPAMSSSSSPAGSMSNDGLCLDPRMPMARLLTSNGGKISRLVKDLSKLNISEALLMVWFQFMTIEWQ